MERSNKAFLVKFLDSRFLTFLEQDGGRCFSRFLLGESPSLEILSSIGSLSIVNPETEVVSCSRHMP